MPPAADGPPGLHVLNLGSGQSRHGEGLASQWRCSPWPLPRPRRQRRVDGASIGLLPLVRAFTMIRVAGEGGIRWPLARRIRCSDQSTSLTGAAQRMSGLIDRFVEWGQQLVDAIGYLGLAI